MERFSPGICNDVSVEQADASRVVCADEGSTDTDKQIISDGTVSRRPIRIGISPEAVWFAMLAVILLYSSLVLRLSAIARRLAVQPLRVFLSSQPVSIRRTPSRRR
jgi:hypothetical protein